MQRARKVDDLYTSGETALRSLIPRDKPALAALGFKALNALKPSKPHAPNH